MPENKSTKMGPATFTQHYETDPSGAVKAILKFEQPKARMTSDEALALRDAVLDAYKQDLISVWFDQAGAKLVSAGKIREGLAADRALIDAHPSAALHHAQIAPAHPPGHLRTPREWLASWSLRARSGSGKGRNTPASDAA
jgi:hypothetical protein